MSKQRLSLPEFKREAASLGLEHGYSYLPQPSRLGW